MYIYIYIKHHAVWSPSFDPPLRFYQKYPVKNSFFQLFPSKKTSLVLLSGCLSKPNIPNIPLLFNKPKSPSEVLSQRWIHKGSSQKGFGGAGRSCRTHEFLTDRRTEARQDRRFTEVAEEHVLLFVDETGSLLAACKDGVCPTRGCF